MNNHNSNIIKLIKQQNSDQPNRRLTSKPPKKSGFKIISRSTTKTETHLLDNGVQKIKLLLNNNLPIKEPSKPPITETICNVKPLTETICNVKPLTETISEVKPLTEIISEVKPLTEQITSSDIKNYQNNIIVLNEKKSNNNFEEELPKHKLINKPNKSLIQSEKYTRYNNTTKHNQANKFKQVAKPDEITKESNKVKLANEALTIYLSKQTEAQTETQTEKQISKQIVRTKTKTKTKKTEDNDNCSPIIIPRNRKTIDRSLFKVINKIENEPYNANSYDLLSPENYYGSICFSLESIRPPWFEKYLIREQQTDNIVSNITEISFQKMEISECTSANKEPQQQKKSTGNKILIFNDIIINPNI